MLDMYTLKNCPENIKRSLLYFLGAVLCEPSEDSVDYNSALTYTYSTHALHSLPAVRSLSRGPCFPVSHGTGSRSGFMDQCVCVYGGGSG